MQFQYTSYILPLIAAAAISGWVAVYAWKRRSVRGAYALSILAIAITVWSSGYALEIAGADLSTKLFWGKSQYIGIVVTPLMWLIFVTEYSNITRPLAHREKILLSIVPLITLVLAFTTEYHGLVWKEILIDVAGNFSALDVSYGPWFWVHSAYSYILLLAGAVIILRLIGSKQRLYRDQAVGLLVAMIAPWFGNILYLSGFSPIPYLDLTPFAFTLTVVALTWSIYGFQLIDIAPVARDNVVEEMNDGMIVLDTQNRIADINPSAQRMIGIPASQAIGQMSAEVFNPWSDITERYRDVVETMDEICIGAGDSMRWYDLRLSPLYDRRKRLVGRIITLRDITNRKQAEDQLRQLSRAVEASPTSIVITDTSGRIQYVNPKFTEVTGYTLQELVGEKPNILKTGLTSQETYRQLWETITAGREWRGEFCNRKKNGELYWESASISPISDNAGTITHYVAVKEDITMIKRAQESLSLALDQALEASRIKSHLLAKVSHELRTPLGGILGYAELLQCESFGPLTDTQKRVAGQIIESSHYLNSIINELLDAAQIEAKKLALRIDRCSPSAILQKVEASMIPLAHNKGLALTSSISPTLPDSIYGDEQRLQQILTNLVGNAIKYTRTGEVRVNLLYPDPTQWVIQVIDTGVGIPKEARTYIFEPFRQVDNSITQENRGTGLGLSITKQLVDLMGGKIKLESEVGSGSTFTVVLPIMDIREETEA